MVLLKIDAEKDPHGPEYSKKQSIQGYPTFIVMNAKGEPINRWMGYDKSGFTRTFNATLADLSTITEKEARLAAHPTPQDAEVVAGYRYASGDYKGAVDTYHQAVRLGGPSGPDYAMEIFETTFYGAGKGGPFTSEDVKKAGQDALGSKSATPSDLVDLAMMMASIAEKEQNPGLLVPYLKTAEERTRGVDDPDVVSARRNLMPRYALYVEKDKEKALAYQKARLPEGWMEDAGQLNGFAWWCFENQVNIAEARTLAEKAVTLSPPGREKAEALDTAAELANCQNDVKRAIELSRQAVAQDPDVPHFRDQVTRFEAALSKRS